MLGNTRDAEVQRFGREARAMWADFARTGAAPGQTEWLHPAG
jgi:hypothetical protein